MKNKALNAGLWLKDNVFRLIVLISTTSLFVFAVFSLINNPQNIRVDLVSISGFCVIGLIALAPIAFAVYRIATSKKNSTMPYSFMEIFLKTMATMGVVLAYYLFVVYFIVLPANL